MPEAPYGRATRWLTCGTLTPGAVSRDDVVRAFEQADIECRPVWKPMHMQPLYAECLRFGESVDQRLFEDGLCLPSGSSLSDAERTRISATLDSVLSVRRR